MVIESIKNLFRVLWSIPSMMIGKTGIILMKNVTLEYTTRIAEIAELMKKNTPQTLVAVMKILEGKGIKIKKISVTKELAERMIKCRDMIDKNGPNLNLLNMDTEFDMFLNAKKYANVKKKSKDEIGMMMGIQIVKEGKW